MKVIAEIGVNHDGKLSKAKKLIKFSKLSGADYVKFQLYKTENLVITNSSTASYQKKISNNQYELLKKYELSLKKFKILFRYCLQIKIQPLVTCFDLETFKEVNSNFKFNTYKIGSGDLDNFPLISPNSSCLSLCTAQSLSITLTFIKTPLFKNLATSTEFGSWWTLYGTSYCFNSWFKIIPHLSAIEKAS